MEEKDVEDSISASYVKEVLREGEFRRREKDSPRSYLYPRRGDMVSIHFSMKLSKDQTVIDDTRDKGTPVKFRVGYAEMIQGLDEAVMTMCLGEMANVQIESQYAYGLNGVSRIPPDSNITVSQLEIVSINDTVPGKAFILKHLKGRGGKCVLS